MLEFITRDLAFKFLKFGVVGASGMIVDFGFTYLLKEIMKVPKYVANACGFTLAATSNYFLNRWWTFQSHNPNIGMEYTKFIFFSLLGLGINMLVIWILVSRYKRNFYFSKLLAIGVVTFWNFIVNVIYTFA
jgi:putative flippase GtrA